MLLDGIRWEGHLSRYTQYVSSNSLETTYILFKVPYKACCNQHAMKHDIKRLEQTGFSFLKLGHLDAY